MQFHVSHGFMQGETHTVCEDYATSALIQGKDLSVKENPLVIVSDGCSAVHNTDVGARIIALAAEKVLSEYIAAQIVPYPREVARDIRFIATDICNKLGVDVDCCTATLLAAFVLDGMCHVYAFGDGAWYMTVKGVVRGTVIYSPEDAPPYLIKLSSPNYELLKDSGELRATTGTDEEITMDGHFYWSFPADDVEELGIATDGVFAVAGRSPLDVLKIMSGRRVQVSLNDFNKRIAYDDIGLAIIAIEH